MLISRCVGRCGLAYIAACAMMVAVLTGAAFASGGKLKYIGEVTDSFGGRLMAYIGTESGIKIATLVMMGSGGGWVDAVVFATVSPGDLRAIRDCAYRMWKGRATKARNDMWYEDPLDSRDRKLSEGDIGVALLTASSGKTRLCISFGSTEYDSTRPMFVVSSDRDLNMFVWLLSRLESSIRSSR